MGLDDLVDKGKELLGEGTEKAKEFLSSDKAEQVTDDILEKGANAVNKATGGKYADKIQDVTEKIDKSVGTE